MKIIAFKKVLHIDVIYPLTSLNASNHVLDITITNFVYIILALYIGYST